ncbi:MAG: hypothetical protein N2322_07950, partial [Terrimicrobiaceae bacterium]|nr:hypothetical protein [Terrimicrobiaceae bacterium]
ESGRVAVTHLVSAEPAEISDDRIVVWGTMGWAKTKAMTPLRLVALRLLMLGGGRFFPDLVRRVLQRLLITGKSAAPFQYRREVVWEAGGALRVRDEVRGPDWSRVAEAAIGCAQTSIYVVMSRTYQASQLLPWARLDAELAAARESGVLEAERRL